jgi:hypothetical protein
MVMLAEHLTFCPIAGFKFRPSAVQPVRLLGNAALCDPPGVSQRDERLVIAGCLDGTCGGPASRCRFERVSLWSFRVRDSTE